uniref:ATP-dependent DNA helicase n=1 Tax=Nicotiana tabacum TaxID=4097 RepID=A0A1S4CXR3_TOBAC|nr:PREDICTED: uncharacterized protein LOC107823742 [Nicotiana tabacum]XP_016505919.1 PREDICTED: uncharacterized protein LOC107823742 [Nicotiana tabacum]XP_016505920.1 PREDICTED: uncharacterized protein LOC107823742 [Nicotiana tabacum]XP_016505921.1 PREDICTED: uncharacterized protein LOC107823742 [Nicotiana tabacum]XP_016505922.1 PREDICTED: uncharacterized protein LOC107823742 [Nicotiana tabacum]XP_016505923.1 PREDICTED: uncharacterized protein LOC107823742 [Nicotiana tabacum]XP_016505924.1 PR
MAKKKIIETFDLLLKDLLNNNVLFGGTVVVFGGDFKQTLPVVRNGKKKDFIHESLLYYDIWPRLEKLQLSENMRAKTDPVFCEYLMRIGNGKEPLSSENKIEIPNSFIVPYTTEQESLNVLFEITFPNMHDFFCDASSMTSRVILTKDDFVDEINDMLIGKFPKEDKTFVAIDEICESNDQSQYEDFLHSLNPAGLPPYRLTLKENCPIILLRNLNPCEGLCNGTRLTCCDFKTHVISAKIVSGDFKNTHVFIPRIPLMSSQTLFCYDYKYSTRSNIRFCWNIFTRTSVFTWSTLCCIVESKSFQLCQVINSTPKPR